MFVSLDKDAFKRMSERGPHCAFARSDWAAEEYCRLRVCHDDDGYLNLGRCAPLCVHPLQRSFCDVLRLRIAASLSANIMAECQTAFKRDPDRRRTEAPFSDMIWFVEDLPLLIWLRASPTRCPAPFSKTAKMPPREASLIENVARRDA